MPWTEISCQFLTIYRSFAWAVTRERIEVASFLFRTLGPKILRTYKKRNHGISFARGENSYHTNKTNEAFFHVDIFVFQVISVVFVLYSIGNSGAQPSHSGLWRTIQRNKKHTKLLTAPPRRCNHTLPGSGYAVHTSTSDASLWYKNGWFLAVYKDGNINGTSDARSPDSK